MPVPPPPPVPPQPLKRLRSDELDRPFLPPPRARWPGQVAGGVLALAALGGLGWGSVWLWDNHANLDFVPPWARGNPAATAPVQADPNAPPVPLQDAAVRSSRVTTPGGAPGQRAPNACSGPTPDADCPPASVPAGPAPESEISRIRAANAKAAPAEIRSGGEVTTRDTAPLKVGRTPEQQAAAAAGVGVATGAAPPDKGQECDFLRVRIGEIDAMLAQGYPAKVKDGLRDEQKRGRSRMASLGC